jgi:tRNA threonylcarbamoyladenosine biosynthesis protein TsaE
VYSIQVELRQQGDTDKLGALLGQSAVPGDVICLDGDLGAGKTTLTQAIARGAGVPEDCYVTSPSFAILHEYQGRLPVYHMDFYRLNNDADVLDLGFDEYFYLAGLTVIEWAKRAETILPQERLSLELQLHDDMRRTATITATDAYAERLRRLEKAFRAAA